MADDIDRMPLNAFAARFPSPVANDQADSVLEASLTVASVEELFPHGRYTQDVKTRGHTPTYVVYRLPPEHAFSWQSIAADPKGEHGPLFTLPFYCFAIAA